MILTHQDSKLEAINCHHNYIYVYIIYTHIYIAVLRMHYNIMYYILLCNLRTAAVLACCAWSPQHSSEYSSRLSNEAYKYTAKHLIGVLHQLVRKVCCTTHMEAKAMVCTVVGRSARMNHNQSRMFHYLIFSNI